MKKIILFFVYMCTMTYTMNVAAVNSKDYTQVLEKFYDRVNTTYSQPSERISIYKNVKQRLLKVLTKYNNNYEKYKQVIEIIDGLIEGIDKEIDTYGTTTIVQNKNINVSFVIPESMENSFSSMPSGLESKDKDSIINYGSFFSAVNDLALPPIGGIGPADFVEAKFLVPGYGEKDLRFEEYCNKQIEDDQTTFLTCELHTTKNGFRYIKKEFVWEGVYSDGKKYNYLWYFVENKGSEFSVLAFESIYTEDEQHSEYIEDEKKFKRIIGSIQKLK